MLLIVNRIKAAIILNNHVNPAIFESCSDSPPPSIKSRNRKQSEGCIAEDSVGIERVNSEQD